MQKKLLPLAAGTAAVFVSACSGTSDDANLVAGKQAFVAKCGSCHVLSRAGTKGNTGPNLDEAFVQAKQDGFGRKSIEGVVRKQIQHPSNAGRAANAVAGVAGTGVMPANLVSGDTVDDVAAYVASAVGESGEDSGLLATAVPKAGAGKPIAASAGVLEIAADPTGQLAFASTKATAKAGEITVRMPNKSGVPHNIVIDGKGAGKVVPRGVSEFKANFAPGEYTFYCAVPGHREAGMEGKLTVT